MVAFFKLIRYKNLLIIVLSQLLVKYALLEAFGVQTSLNIFQFSILILATVCIAAAGNIINDIYDVETDLINKPNKVIIGKLIPENVAFNAFIILNVIGVVCGFYVSNIIDKPAFFSIFIIVSVLLYVYANYLKRYALIGNMVISALVGFSILIVGVFELIPSLTLDNRTIQLTFFKLIFNYSAFAFCINLLREIAKDLEDYEGDLEANMATLPIVFGLKNTKILLAILNFIPLILIIIHVINQLYKNTIAVIYFLLFVIAPLLYIAIKTYSSNDKKAFKHLSNLYKIVLVFGMLSLLLYKYEILN
ncbi:geranylgeranylglycerol-phosphate geranylgeranyltransferase [Tamlana sp. 62-3]|uniref:Geranylgeranylglycerol-phosphate geranylgeranyltransferase n=1 Tax=Neotamlana sargassicola TaxID=2883125 RepID=A0A9X1I6K8_9FLAO|nr:geranylgeranylglycerol-phosphate geranylgeranyltransferase [Tamlana sargassicola]MCB4808403.1 geranylgeranylglycerol-phosphate geranylgeranyltransferase [Tamlana sargassicola]